MASAHPLFPHKEIEQLSDGLWQLEGSQSTPIPRNMTLYRLPDGGLLLYSVIALDEETMKEVESLGSPTIMVVPHPFHIQDARFYQERYPSLQIIAPVHAQKRMAKHHGMDVAGMLEPGPGLEKFGIRHRIVPGMKYTEIMLNVDVEGGRALLFTDIFTCTGQKSLLDRLVGAPHGGIGLSRVVRLRQVNDKKAVAAFFEELSRDESIRFLLTCHGKAIVNDCAATLAHAARHI